jgi:hypothetical protein
MQSQKSSHRDAPELVLLQLSTLLRQLALPALEHARQQVRLAGDGLTHPLDGLASVLRQMARLTAESGEIENFD